MTCTNFGFNNSLSLKCKPFELDIIDFEKFLRNLTYSQTQIDWVLETINKIASNGWFIIDSVAEFPLNHDYGFTKDGDCEEGSKWNLKIGFVHEDTENKWSGKQSSFYTIN